MLVISDIVAHEGVEWLLSKLRENPYEIALGRYLGAEDQATLSALLPQAPVRWSLISNP